MAILHYHVWLLHSVNYMDFKELVQNLKFFLKDLSNLPIIWFWELICKLVTKLLPGIRQRIFVKLLSPTKTFETRPSVNNFAKLLWIVNASSVVYLFKDLVYQRILWSLSLLSLLLLLMLLQFLSSFLPLLE